MKKLFLIFSIIFTLVSCSKSDDGDGKDGKGDGKNTNNREFKVDSNLQAINVQLTGAFMGTPDYNKVWNIIQKAKNEGKIDKIKQFAVPIEGGIAHCIEIRNKNYRIKILNDLIQTETSETESSYSLESIPACN